MRPENVEDIYPLTPMQRLMLLHSLTAADADLLVNRVRFQLEGDVDAGRLERAWQAVIDRHPALRTCFLWEGLDHPVQVVRERVTFQMERDPTERDPTERDPTKRDAPSTDFDIRRAPLMRCRLSVAAPGRATLDWSVHHLIVDRWSLETILADLSVAYDRLGSSTSTALEPGSPFRDYVAWIDRQDAAEVERYWQKELLDFAPTPVAPTARRGEADLAPPGEDRRSRSRVSRALDPEVLSGLDDRESAWGTTRASVLFLGIGLLVAQRTNARDIAYGVTVSGRPPDLPSSEDTVGSFVNNVPLRIRCDPDTPLADLATELQRRNALRYAYEHASPSDILSWMPRPDLGPPFDVLVLMNLNEPEPLRLADLNVTPLSASLEAGYPFLLSFESREHGVQVDLIHDAELDGERFLDDLGAVLGQLSRTGEDATVGDVVPPGSTTPDSDTSSPPQPAPGPDAAAARTTTTMTAMFAQVLGISDVELDDDFFDLGGSSLQAAHLFARIERLTGRSLPLATLLEARTPRALLDVVGQPADATGPVIPFRATGSRPPLVVAPGVGGNVISLNWLAEALDAERPFFALQSRGLTGETEPLTSIEAIAEDFAREVLDSLDGEVHLLGVCWGAAVVFEMMRVLQREGRPPLSVGLIDPTLLAEDAELETVDVRKQFIRDRLSLYRKQFLEEDWRGRTRFVTSKLKRVTKLARGGEAAGASRFDYHITKVAMTNEQAIGQYRPSPGNTRACLFVTSGREVGEGEDSRLGWLELISPTPDVRMIPGADTGDALDPGNVEEFAELLTTWLGECDQPPDQT